MILISDPLKCSWGANAASKKRIIIPLQPGAVSRKSTVRWLRVSGFDFSSGPAYQSF